MFDLQAVQKALREFHFDGWLLCDFRGSNLLARRVLDIPDSKKTTRRWAYYIPASGEPRKLEHRIEPGVLAHLPGRAESYLRWQSFEEAIRSCVAGTKRVAMEYSPRNAVPVVARVDAGTVELVNSFGVAVESSGDLIQLFEAVWDDKQWQLHLEAARHTDAAFDKTWRLIAESIRSTGLITELQVQQFIMDHFAANGLTTYSPPIVGVNAHSGDPHFENSSANDTPIREGDFLLVDLWAKMDKPRAVYSDLTRVAYIGKETPEKYETVFQIVAAARDAAIERVRAAFSRGEALKGYQVDDAAREVIEKAGYGDAFIHRTGHSIGQETHGNGANMDNLETHEERLVLPQTCFSIEPGIYLPEFGVRSETNVYIAADRTVHVTGGELQKRVLPLLAEY
jgi:Xaa-Pro dipeptidase